jgi:hypothetical protein
MAHLLAPLFGTQHEGAGSNGKTGGGESGSKQEHEQEGGSRQQTADSERDMFLVTDPSAFRVAAARHGRTQR